MRYHGVQARQLVAFFQSIGRPSSGKLRILQQTERRSPITAQVRRLVQSDGCEAGASRPKCLTHAVISIRTPRRDVGHVRVYM